MKQTLQLKLTQHLTLTPQLQQSIRLLQLSTMELNQELERFLAENPLLERDEGDEDGAPAARLNGASTVSTVSVDTASPERAPSLPWRCLLRARTPRSPGRWPARSSWKDS